MIADDRSVDADLDAKVADLLAQSGPEECIDINDVSQDDLLLYSRGKLKGTAKDEVERHLFDCGYCRSVVGTFQSIEAQPPKWLPVFLSWSRTPIIALATAAAAILFFGSLSTVGPAVALLEKGGQAVQRGEESPSDIWAFASTGQLRIRVNPTDPVKDKSVELAVKVDRSDGKIVFAEGLSVKREWDGDYVSFVVHGAGRDFCGERKGDCALTFQVVSEGGVVAMVTQKVHYVVQNETK